MKATPLVIAIALFCALALSPEARAQLEIGSSGNVGINSSPSTDAGLRVGAVNIDYAILAWSFGCTPNCPYAGYFDGDVHVTGTFTNPSDAAFKENNVFLAETGGVLQRLLQLRPQRFTFTRQAPIGLPAGEHFGVTAQEVEALFPELVKEEVHPGEMDEEGNVVGEPIRYKSVNYIEMIPLLIQALQEQQAVIDEQQRRIEALETGRNR